MQKPGGPEPRLVAAYKAILKEYIDRRPSGMRARIAATLGKNNRRAPPLTFGRGPPDPDSARSRMG